jgi:hypothetical protein
VASWGRKALRIFGTLHITMSGLGFIMIVETLTIALPRDLRGRPADPYFMVFFLMGIIASLFCLVLLAAAGVALRRDDPRGVRWSNIALTAELAWVVLRAVAGSTLLMSTGLARLVGRSMVSAWLGDAGFVIQVLTGYPVIALVAVNLASRSERRVKPD